MNPWPQTGISATGIDISGPAAHESLLTEREREGGKSSCCHPGALGCFSALGSSPPLPWAPPPLHAEHSPRSFLCARFLIFCIKKKCTYITHAPETSRVIQTFLLFWEDFQLRGSQNSAPSLCASTGSIKTLKLEQLFVLVPSYHVTPTLPPTSAGFSGRDWRGNAKLPNPAQKVHQLLGRPAWVGCAADALALPTDE